MTPSMVPGIKHREPITVIITVTVAVAGARPAIIFCFSFVSTLLGSSPLFPSTAGNSIECRQCFTWHAIVQVHTTMSRGPSLS
jgi:hypothetical protein